MYSLKYWRVHQSALPRITELYAFIVDGDGPEDGIVASGLDGPWGMVVMALVTSDSKMVARMMVVAQEISKESGKTIKIMKFTSREWIGTVTPTLATLGDNYK